MNEQDLESVKKVLKIQMDINKEIVDKALSYIKDDNDKLLFINDCERIVFIKLKHAEEIKKEIENGNTINK